MAIVGLDGSSWQVEVLTLPGSAARGAALGLLGETPFGTVQTPDTHQCDSLWWPAKEPVAIFPEPANRCLLYAASDVRLAGTRYGSDGHQQAVLWRRQGSSLQEVSLHDSRFTETLALGSGADLVVGSGRYAADPNTPYPVDVGLIWREDGPARVLAAEGPVRLLATDGTAVAGVFRRHGAYWATRDSALVSFEEPDITVSEIRALDGGFQYGTIWQGLVSHATVWQGAPSTRQGLTPSGLGMSVLHHAVPGWQVGYGRTRHQTGSGTPALDSRALLWQGSADRSFDFTHILPAGGYNAAEAHGIAVHEGRLLIAGAALRVAVEGAGTDREFHTVEAEQPVVWTVELA